jgi:hypothetical protein
VQDIGIVSSQAPTVNWTPGARYAYLTFEGLRESRTIGDKRTRIRISLPAAELDRLRASLARAASDGQE